MLDDEAESASEKVFAKDLKRELRRNLARGEMTLYVIKCGPYYKVGITKHPVLRLNSLRTMIPLEIEYVHHIQIPGHYARRFELRVHKFLNKYHHKGEWFEVSLNMIMRALSEASRHSGKWDREFDVAITKKPWTRALVGIGLAK